MRISDWSSDVCSSDLHLARQRIAKRRPHVPQPGFEPVIAARLVKDQRMDIALDRPVRRAIDPVSDRGDPESSHFHDRSMARMGECESLLYSPIIWLNRSEEHTSELQSLMRISNA